MLIDNEKLINELNINVDNIFHIIFIDGTEMIGELFDSNNVEIETTEEVGLDLEISECEIDFENDVKEKNSLLFLNPIKIVKNIFMDENGENIKIEGYEIWNSSIEGPFTHIYKNSILSQNTPNEKTLDNYLKSIHALYCPDIIEDEDVILIKDKKNVIKNVSNFNIYHFKRLNGIF